MPRIVIIGGGPAGINTAQALARTLKPADGVEVVLLEKSAFYYHTIGTPRAYVEPAFVNKLFIPYDHAIPKSAAAFVKVVRAVVTAISAEKGEVKFCKIDANDTESSEVETLAFDYLVIATGSTYTVPIKPDSKDFSRASTEAKLKQVYAQIEQADKILVVGGGAVGCEVAGDIASKFPTKSVTILEAREKLIAGNNLRDKFRLKLNAGLAKLQIRVILGERLEGERLAGNVFEKRTLRTDKGTEIESDIQLLCGGFSPVSELVAAMDASLVDDRGFIKVNPQLQFDSAAFAHMFVVGDASNHPTPKLAYWAGEQGKFLAHELAAVVRGKQSGFAKPYPIVTVEALLLPLGPGGGVSQLPVWGGVVVGDMMTRMIKGKDFFAGKTWGDLGATLPK
jgi:NADH dehydrogenase FAD-containing subunit